MKLFILVFIQDSNPIIERPEIHFSYWCDQPLYVYRYGFKLQKKRFIFIRAQPASEA